ncbi:MAG: DNA polymerase III subunit gamma/tau [Mycoplasma sp.]
MEKLALYRKYRPRNFEQIFGQQIVVKTLTNAIITNNLNHAYIFAGNKGSGKTSIAKIFAKAINCLSNQDGSPCGQCVNCLAIQENNCTDILELDAASNSGVAEIRNIIDSINYLPTQLKYKVYIIDEAHMLTTNSWNAFLKTLEEPPTHVVIIFATTEYHKIPATIISRCQRYDFNKIPRKELCKLIEDVSSKEGISIDKESIISIASLANGAARDALSILDQLSNFCSKSINIDQINSMFGIVDSSTKIKLLNAIYESDVVTTLELIKKFNSSGINFSSLLHDLVEMLMDKMIYLQTNDVSLMQCLNADNVNELKQNNIVNLLELIKHMINNTQNLKNSDQQFTIFEFICLKSMNVENIQANITNAQHTTPKVIIDQPKIEIVKPVEKVVEIVQEPTQPSFFEEPKEEITEVESKPTQPSFFEEPKEEITEVESKPTQPSFFEEPKQEVEKNVTPLVIPNFDKPSMFKTKDVTNDYNKIEEKVQEVNQPMEPESTQPIQSKIRPMNEYKMNNPNTVNIDSIKTSEFSNIISSTNVVDQNVAKPPMNESINLQTVIEKQSIIQNQQEQICKIDFNDESYKNDFFAIAANHKKDMKDAHNVTLNDMKEFISLYDTKVQPFLKAIQFLIASNNGAVILFNEKEEAEKFNRISESESFMKLFAESFGKEKVVLGIFTEKALQLKDEFKNLINKEISDVERKCKNNDNISVKELLNILNDDE